MVQDDTVKKHIVQYDIRYCTARYGTKRYGPPRYGMPRVLPYVATYDSLVLTSLALWLSLPNASYVAQYLQAMPGEEPAHVGEGEQVDRLDTTERG